jgi:hypothetical protein
MKDLELSIHESAIEKGLNREIINLALDNDAKMYRAFCEFGLIKTYLYVPSKGLSEGQACRVLLSLMSVYYNGGNIDKVLGDLIAEQIGEEEEEGAKAEKKPAKRAARKPEPEAVVADEVPEEPKEEAKAPVKKTRKKVTKAKVEKTIAYDRNQVPHKKELSKVLGENFPEWHKNKDLVAKAKTTSESLVGVAIFDSKGAVLPTFEQNVLELMGVSEEDNL